jgi:chromosome partitioning protein
MTARIFTVAQQKGGAGKTSLAAHLAVAWAQAGHAVAVLDIDPQASLSAWFGERTGDANIALTVETAAGWRTAARVEELARGRDIVLIDTPPHSETEARVAIRAADLVVVPLQPSPMDLWATRPTLAMVEQENRRSLLVWNRVPARARLTATLEAKVAELGVAVADSRIGNRVALAESLAAGQGITEFAPSSAAAREISALAKDLAEA